jgi:hypothetical protein
MWRSTITVHVLLLAACAHQHTVAHPEATPTAQIAGTAAGGATQPAAAIAAQPAAAPAAQPVAATATSANGAAPVPAVNKDLLKQGYHTGLRHGQLVYCRTEQLTGTRFKSQVCMSEAQILDEQKRARDQMNASQHVQCMGPECRG